MSIKSKLILLMSGILLVVGSALAGVIYWQISQAIAGHVNDDVRNAIDYNNQLVNFYIDRAKSNLMNIASDKAMLEALESKDPTVIDQVSKNLTLVKVTVSHLEEIALMEIKGQSCIPIATNEAAKEILSRDLADRDYCKGILKTKAIYLSSAYISAVNKDPVLGLAVPVKNSRGEMLGFVFGSINLTELRGYLWDLQKDSKVELLDRYGTMFLNTEEKITSLGNLSDEEEAEIAYIKNDLSVGRLEGHFNDEGTFVGYKFNGSITVIYEKSAVNLFALVSNLNYSVVISILISILLMIILVYILINSITKRISRLSKISQEIAGGKFEIRLNKRDLKAKDETAVLARAFNDMAGKLSDIYNNLEQKVKERTKKLEESEKAAKRSLDLSEKANRLMVGRELEMIKLKKEISELKKTK